MVVSQKQLLKVAIKHEGNKNKTAKELGISHQAVGKRLKNNPHLKKAILNVREAAIQKSGLSRAFVYRGIKEGCKAKVIVISDGKASKTNIADHDTRHKYLKTALELHKDLDPDKEQSQQNIAMVIYNILHNPNRKVIDVV